MFKNLYCIVMVKKYFFNFLEGVRRAEGQDHGLSGIVGTPNPTSFRKKSTGENSLCIDMARAWGEWLNLGLEVSL
jgi:hypothetical protein